MIYAATITVPSNTLESDPVLTDITITRGLIYLIEVGMPAGCAGLAHVQLFDGSYQIFPATPGESFHGDGVLKGYDDLYFKESAPFFLRIKSWNIDTVWDHTVTVRVGLASSETEISRYLPGIGLEKMAEALVSMQAVQEEVKRVQLEEIINSLTGGENGNG